MQSCATGTATDLEILNSFHLFFVWNIVSDEHLRGDSIIC